MEGSCPPTKKIRLEVPKRKFTCTECDFSTQRTSNLTRHKVTFHPDLTAIVVNNDAPEIHSDDNEMLTGGREMIVPEPETNQDAVYEIYDLKFLQPLCDRME